MNRVKLSRRYNLVLLREVGGANNQLSELKENIQFQESLPENFGNAHGKTSPLILDDLPNQVYSEAVFDLFTKNSYHRNVSVMLVT